MKKGLSILLVMGMLLTLTAIPSFADEGEKIWDIAKRYNTSVRSIIDDNGLTGDEIEKRGMVLIPIVD